MLLELCWCWCSPYSEAEIVCIRLMDHHCVSLTHLYTIQPWQWMFLIMNVFANQLLLGRFKELLDLKLDCLKRALKNPQSSVIEIDGYHKFVMALTLLEPIPSSVAFNIVSRGSYGDQKQFINISWS